MPARPTSTPMPPRIFLMIFCSNVSSSSSWACCANAAAGSARSAPQTLAIRSPRRLIRDRSSRMAITRPAGSLLRYPATLAAPLGATSAILRGGSGRFCGANRYKGFIQESHDPLNDGCIRQVEHVPDEIERFRGDMKKDEVDHRPIDEAVDGIPDRAANDQAE